MTPEQKAAFVNARVAVFQCRMAGMIADNMQREHQGMAMAFSLIEFDALEREFGDIGHNALIDFFRE